MYAVAKTPPARPIFNKFCAVNIGAAVPATLPITDVVVVPVTVEAAVTALALAAVTAPQMDEAAAPTAGTAVPVIHGIAVVATKVFAEAKPVKAPAPYAAYAAAPKPSSQNIPSVELFSRLSSKSTEFWGS